MSSQERLEARILLADDDVIFRSLCVAKLKSFGLEVVQAEDGVEAWHLLKDGGFALALLDVDMPNMGGVTLVQCIRTHPQTRHMPVVMITSREDVNSVRATLQAGATSYLTKPVNWSLFNDHISHLLTLGRGVMGGAPEVGHDRAVLEASRALNTLYGRELGKLTREDPAAAGRSRSLMGLGDLLSSLDGVQSEAIDLRQAVEAVTQGAHQRIAINLQETRFVGVGAAFEALLAELAESAELINSDSQRPELSVERRGQQVRVGLTVAGASGADGDQLGFALQKLSILAALNEGELFFDDGGDATEFAFGVTFDRPLDEEHAPVCVSDDEVATPV